MATVTFDLNATGIVQGGPQTEGNDGVNQYVQFYAPFYSGIRYDFSFVGTQIELNVGGAGSGSGTVSFLVYIDGVAQDRIAVDAAFSFQVAWSGSQGTHQVALVNDNGGTLVVGNITTTGSIRITSNTSATIGYATGFGPSFPLLTSSGIVPETRAFVEASGSAYLLHPAESFRFKATCTSLKIFAYFFGTGTAKLAIRVDGTWFPSVDCAVVQQTYGWLDAVSGLANTEHEFVVCWVNDAKGSTPLSGGVFWGIMLNSTGTLNAAPAFTDRPIIYFNGDSLTEWLYSGAGALDYQDAWPFLVGKELDYAVASYGVSGQTVGSMGARIVNELEALLHEPVTICVLGGRNDVFQAVAPATTQADYQSLLSAARGQAPGSCILAIEMILTSNSANNAADAPYLAAEVAGFAAAALTNASFAVSTTWLIQSIADFWGANDAHPNISGDAKIAAQVLDILSPSSGAKAGGSLGLTAGNIQLWRR